MVGANGFDTFAPFYKVFYYPGVARNEFLAWYGKRAKASYAFTVRNLFQQVYHNRRRIMSLN